MGFSATWATGESFHLPNGIIQLLCLWANTFPLKDAQTAPYREAASHLLQL